MKGNDEESFVGELSNIKCPICDRFYTLEEAENIPQCQSILCAKPACTRCQWDSFLKKWDADYQKALQKKQ
jgi:C4-type Zn-finger protein